MKHTHNFLKVLSTITAISCLANSYGITDIASAEETTSDFDPYFFYEEILNEKRPEEAEHFRFIDLDKDRYDELLIYSRSCILTVYTVDKSKMQPKSLFYQSDGSMRNYQICTNGIISYSLSPNQHGSYIGHIRFKLSYGQLEPFLGYAYGSYKGKLQAFKTENKDILSASIPFHYDNDFSKWDSITDEEFNNLFRGKSDNEAFTPWMESFYTYDAQKEFDKTNKAKPIPATGRYGYNDIIQSYKDILSSPSMVKALQVTQGTTCLNTDMYSYLWKEYSYTKTGFVLIDLNDDGIMELAVGCIENDGSFNMFDLYTITDEKVVHIASSGWRDRFSIGKDKEIIESGSSGAADGIAMAYSLGKGKLKPIRVLSVEKGKYYYFYNFGTPYENKTEITREEYFEIEKNQFMKYNDHDVVLFNDWYPGMRINEDPDGDANDDGEINMLDVLLVHKHILSLSDEAKLNTSYVDINKDNTVNVLDLMLLKHSILTQ